MSIQREIARFKANVKDALHAISEKGVTIPTNATSDDLAALIMMIKAVGSFTVDGTSFPFELGVTWAELLESEYNKDGQAFCADDDGFITRNGQLYDSNGVAVHKGDSVVNGMAYTT